MVDDEPDIVAVMKFTLETHGYEVITAYDGEEGLEKAKSENPDLLILDVLMPKVCGDDLGTALKKDPELAGKPIIFMTNLPLHFLVRSEEKDVIIQKDSAGNLYLPKTCTEDDLINAIQQSLKK